MIHRAIYGTLERFTGNLIEHFAGAFPVWLAPEQVRVIPISDAQNEPARALAARLKGAGLRVHVDDRSETLNYRIREGEMQKVPVHGRHRAAGSGQRQPRAPGAGGGEEAGGHARGPRSWSGSAGRCGAGRWRRNLSSVSAAKGTMFGMIRFASG